METQKATPEDVIKLFPHLEDNYIENKILINIRQGGIDFHDCNIKSSRVIRELLKSDPTQIRFIDKPTYELQKLAVSLDSSCIQYVKQTQALCRLAVKNDPSCIGYIKDQTEELCNIVIEYNPHLIKYIRTPTLEMAMKAISTFRSCISDINLTLFTKEELEHLKLLVV